MNSDRGHSISDSPALITYILLQRYMQEGHQLMYQPCLLKLGDIETHVTTDRLIQCSLQPHEVASKTSAYVNKKKSSQESLQNRLYLSIHTSRQLSMYIFDMCNDVQHIGRIVCDRLRHEPNREQQYFSHHAIEKFTTHVIHTQILPLT